MTLIDIEEEAIQQSPCPCYNQDQDDQHPPVRVEPVSNRHWRGHAVYCERCGELLAEYDPPEEPADYRSL